MVWWAALNAPRLIRDGFALNPALSRALANMSAHTINRCTIAPKQTSITGGLSSLARGRAEPPFGMEMEQPQLAPAPGPFLYPYRVECLSATQTNDRFDAASTTPRPSIGRSSIADRQKMRRRQQSLLFQVLSWQVTPLLCAAPVPGLIAPTSAKPIGRRVLGSA